jgi:hypothetical protein
MKIICYISLFAAAMLFMGFSIGTRFPNKINLEVEYSTGFNDGLKCALSIANGYVHSVKEAVDRFYKKPWRLSE